MAGIRVFSAGTAWEVAFSEALRFLEEPEGTLLLGPAIGRYGAEWIEEQSLKERPVRFGARVQEWNEWVKARARDRALSQKRGFRPLNQAAKREHLRATVEILVSRGAFHHLQEIWQEERFFTALLGCLEEARLAGLHEPQAIEHAVNILASGEDQVAREVYEDLWNLLLEYERVLSIQADPRLDEASLLRLAAEQPENSGGPYFLLGFDRLALLEVDFLQELGRSSDLILPLALSEEAIGAILAGRESAMEHPAALALRGLATNFPGKISQKKAEPPSPFPRRRLLAAHSPASEARAAAALGRAALGKVSELRFLVPVDYFQDSSAAQAFREELGLRENFQARSALAHPISRLFFHVLELKEKDFALAHGLELAQLLEFTQNKFGDLASRAARAGIRKGLQDWLRKGESDPELKRFASVLEKLHGMLPASGTAVHFASALELVAKEVGIGELARRAPDLAAEREAHAALSGILRNAQMLAVSTSVEFTFSHWVRELKATLNSPLGEPASFFPLVQFYHFGEWLPPAKPETLTILLGLHKGSEPSREFDFFFEERARRKLSDLLLPTRVQEDLCFLDQAKRAGARGQVIFSWAKHDSGGKEREPSWIAGTLGLVGGEWPEVAPERPDSTFTPKEEVLVPAPKVANFSPSLLESYKECPFKAFAEKILRLEDKVQEASLDLSRLDEGSLVHKALELFYKEKKGKEVQSAAERERLLDECLAEALALQKVEYFKGNESLLAAQLKRLRAQLLEFLSADAANYQKFPFFGQPELEKEVSGLIGGKFPWKGKADRIDLDPEGKKLVVIDYKIGANPPSSGDIEGLKKFQLPLYLDAAVAAHPGFAAAGALYASVATGERNQGLVLKEFNAGKKELKDGERKYFGFGGTSGALHSEEEFASLRERARAEAARLAEAIAAGDFSVRPLEEEESCKRCSVRPACRIRELRSPPREELRRSSPGELLGMLSEPEASPEANKKNRGFNPEQSDALERRGSLVFIEASAGTGKTTVIVERIRRFLLDRTKLEPAHLAVERFAAISFTEKSAQELGSRTATALLEDPQFGAALASQAQQQISTIHGFCRRVIADFPVEAGVSPLAAMLDQKGSEALKAETLEELFLFPSEEIRLALDAALREFSRARIEEILARLQDERPLIREEERRFREGGAPGHIFPEGLAREAMLNLLGLSNHLATLYEAKKRERSVLDFNDLEALSLKVLGSESAREFYRKKFELLLVDEFQDTNSLQRAILEAVARPGWANLFVVGDAKQSIYRFRAADVSVFQGLRREAEKNGNLVTLSRNYRSRAEIVNTANRITKAILPASSEEAPDYEAVDAPAVPELPSGGKVQLVEYGAADQPLKAGESRALEAKLVAKVLGEIRARPGKSPTMALLLRKIAGNEVYLRALSDAGIPFRVGASRGFYGQSVVTDAIALLRVLYGAKNDIALLAVLRSPWVAMNAGAILELAERGDARSPLWDKLRPEEAPSIFEWKCFALHSSLVETLERAFRVYPMGKRELLQSAKLLAIVESLESEARPRLEILDCLSSWSGWERESEASDDAPMPEPGEAGTVQVMTVHAAKGLEFDITLLADLTGRLRNENSPLRIVRGAGLVLKLESEDKSAPYSEIGRKNQERELAELKRLFYVALTRAKQEEFLFLPRSFPVAEPAKWGNCGHFLRAADLSGVVEKIDGDAFLAGEASMAGAKPSRAVPSPWPAPPSHARLRESSITELAALQFCPEFHRLKFVQGWDDRIVELWKRPKQSGRKNKPAEKSAEDVAVLLRALKIERKERGIALHRVLERVKHFEESLESAEIWLREAYEAQGVDPANPELEALLSYDLALLRKFLSSPLGKEFFSSGVEAFPEMPFTWSFEGLRLHGAMDRLVRKPDGSWIVVDYKSSILEESLERYSFQVSSYLAAVHQHAGGEAQVEGYLVDLYRAESHRVGYERDSALQQIGREIAHARSNYTLAEPKTTFVERGVHGGDHCFSCPYSAHCELGKDVLGFS